LVGPLSLPTGSVDATNGARTEETTAGIAVRTDGIDAEFQVP
jgi:hypothetical protein